MRVLLFGASGLLGKELLKIDTTIIQVSHSECDIVNYDSVVSLVKDINPDVIIHAAAMTHNMTCENNKSDCIKTNIIGTANIAIACNLIGCRLVYISTDYVYKGDRGNYKETDSLNPFNFYSWSKLGGECSAIGVFNHLVIRTSFGSAEFGYKKAFIDKWVSKDYVDVVAPMIYEAALSPITGVLNLGTSRKTIYDHANERNCVTASKLSETNHKTPEDTSLNLQKWIDYKTGVSVASPHTSCRVCRSNNLKKYLDLGLMPLSNNLEFTTQRAISQDKFPLQVMFCEECGLSQLSVIIDPEKMFSYYTYRSGVNKPYVDHCRIMAKEFNGKWITKDGFHIDAAGNDGTLLKEFKDEIGHKVLNVDPAMNLVSIAESQGIPSIADFWSMKIAKKIVKENGLADLITATNVFAHLDDVEGFLKACKYALKLKGVVVIENPYLIDFIENMEFDTVYFEHTQYWSVRPLIELCKKVGLELIDCQKIDIHGGTMRYYISHELSYLPNNNVKMFYDKEISEGYDKFEKYKSWKVSVDNLTEGLKKTILDIKKEGKSIVAFGASAKGNTLLNYAKINTDSIDYIIDQTPEKIGKFSPGTGIPIVGMHVLEKGSPDYILILAWNFKDAIMDKLLKFGYKGKFIIPIPNVKIL